MSSANRTRTAQGLTEYVIVVVLVAVALLAAVTLYRNAVDNRVAESTANVLTLDSQSSDDGE